MAQIDDRKASTGGAALKVLHLLCDGPDETADRVIALHSRANQVTVIDLSHESTSYGDVVDEIFSHDKIISW